MLDVTLRIRHGSKILLREVWWTVVELDIECIILGRDDFAALGKDNKILMQAAADRLDVVAHMPTLRATKFNEMSGIQAVDLAEEPEAQKGSRVAAVLDGPAFHSEGGAEFDALEDSDVYIELGEDDPKELQKALQESAAAAREAGMTEQETTRLRKLLNDYESVFGLGWEKPHQPK